MHTKVHQNLMQLIGNQQNAKPHICLFIQHTYSTALLLKLLIKNTIKIEFNIIENSCTIIIRN